MRTDTTWLTAQAETAAAPEDLSDPGLRALCALLQRDDYTGANFLEARRSTSGETEVVLLEALPALGQKPLANDIRHIEPMAVISRAGCQVPIVYPVRCDFPQTVPHLNLGYPGDRRSLCLFDAQPSDVAHIYSPDLLVERIRWWLAETAHGELHGEDQPLDPAIAPSICELILPHDFDPEAQQQYFAFRSSDRPLPPVIMIPATTNPEHWRESFGTTVLVTEPVPHGSMLDLPQNMAELIETYSQIGVDIKAQLKGEFQGDLATGAKRVQVKSCLLLIIITPLLREDGSIGAQSTRAYLSSNSNLQQVGLDLGLLSAAGEKVALLFQDEPADMEALAKIQLLPLNVVKGFSPDQARNSSGLETDGRKGFVAIGAGALGSQVIENCARMGADDWVIVDDDFLLPHNLARHNAPGCRVGQSKSDIAKESIDSLFGPLRAASLHEFVGGPEESDALKDAIAGDRQIVDLSASLDVSRSLAVRENIKAPMVSYFVNPSGTSLIEFSEGRDRNVHLTDIEMEYYWSIFANSELNGHLAVGNTVLIGSCRDASVTIPQHRMGLFAAIASGQVIDPIHKNDGGQIKIWEVQASGEVTILKYDVPQFVKVGLGDWSVSVSTEVQATVSEARTAAGRVETGGILLGSCDRRNRCIYITGALRAPADSRAGASYFERGGHKIEKTIMSAERMTMKHLTYIGEWHTHPMGVNNEPSSDDDDLLDWIAERRELFVMPGIMLIMGENGLRVRTRAAGETQETVI